MTDQSDDQIFRQDEHDFMPLLLLRQDPRRTWANRIFYAYFPACYASSHVHMAIAGEDTLSFVPTIFRSVTALVFKGADIDVTNTYYFYAAALSPMILTSLVLFFVSRDRSVRVTLTGSLVGALIGIPMAIILFQGHVPMGYTRTTWRSPLLRLLTEFDATFSFAISMLFAGTIMFLFLGISYPAASLEKMLLRKRL